ncbi:hypothetical protein SEVIR_1G244900v4 [Setaria viridis]
MVITHNIEIIYQPGVRSRLVLFLLFTVERGEKRVAPRRLRVPPAISLALFLSSGCSSTGEGGEPVNRRTAVCSSRCRATSSRLYLPAATFISTSKVRIPLLFSSGSSGDGVGSGEVRRRRLVFLYLLAFGVELLYIPLGFVFCVGDLVASGGIVFWLACAGSSLAAQRGSSAGSLLLVDGRGASLLSSWPPARW